MVSLAPGAIRITLPVAVSRRRTAPAAERAFEALTLTSSITAGVRTVNAISIGVDWSSKLRGDELRSRTSGAQGPHVEAMEDAAHASTAQLSQTEAALRMARS